VKDNDVEELITRLPRPSPSQELDARIAAIANRARSERKTSLTRGALLLIGTAACAGFVGFMLGRQSASMADKLHTAAGEAVMRAALPEPKDASEDVKASPAEGEALARFVMPPKPFVSVFGNGRLEKQDAHSPLE
jgi:hypothetical protein